MEDRQMTTMRENMRVRIIRSGAFNGRCGVVLDADDDRRVANVLLDEKDRELPPPYGVVSTVEEDYDYLELLEPSIQG